MGNRHSSRNKKYSAAYRKIVTQKGSRVGKIHLSQFNHAITILNETEETFNGKPMKNSSDLQSPDTRVVDANPDDIELTSLDRLDGAAATVDYALYEYLFENLIFEGGGNKGLAYCGALEDWKLVNQWLNSEYTPGRVDERRSIHCTYTTPSTSDVMRVTDEILEEIGILKNIKRFGGTSAGAMTATLLSIGYSAAEIEEFLGQDLRRVFLDASCGYCSLLPNLMTGYGWNPGKRVLKWFGNIIATKTVNNNADLTFQQLYDDFGKELCVVVTNLSQMSTEYCHVKTTPDLPIRIAVRMSMSIPGMFRAVSYIHDWDKDVYVDGGVLCNYPIHAYDGWWLSMNREDRFLRRLQPLTQLSQIYEKKERFGTYNEKTLGFLLYADDEDDVLRTTLEKRKGVELPTDNDMPDTKLKRAKWTKRSLKSRAADEYRNVSHAVDAFLSVLMRHNIDDKRSIKRSELEAAFKDETEFTRKQAETLFGRDVTIQEAFESIDTNNDDEIKYNDLVKFIEKMGISYQAQFTGFHRSKVSSFPKFLNTLQSTLLTNMKRVYVEERDAERTVGINTGYIGTTDFLLEPGAADQAREAIH